MKGPTNKNNFCRKGRKERKENLVSFCRVGIAHHHGMSKGCILSGNARPTLLQTYNCFFSRSLRPLRQKVFQFFHRPIRIEIGHSRSDTVCQVKC